MKWENGLVTIKEEGGVLGRILLASQDINAGDEIFSCKSKAIAIDSNTESLEGNCFWCGKQCSEYPISCTNCQAKFCAGCVHGYDNHTGLECAILSQYQSGTGGDSLVRQGVLALRLLLIHCDPDRDSDDRVIKPEGDVQVSLYDLVGEAEACDETRTVLAADIMKAVLSEECRKHYPSQFSDGDISEQKLLLILDIMHRNAFKCNNIITVFPELSLVNHSCMPNAVVTVGYETVSDAKRGVNESVLMATVRAIRPITMGEEVTISYYPLGLNPTEIRQVVIQSKHGFCCGCHACSLSTDQNDDRLLLKQDETHFGDIELILEPLLEVFESADEEMELLTSAQQSRDNSMRESIELTCGMSSDSIPDESIDDEKFEDMKFLLMRAKAGIENLKLGDVHYLRLKYLVMSAETSVLQGKRQEVVENCEEWLQLVNDAPDNIQMLCDAHLRCRMLVLCGENAASFFLSKTESALENTKKKKNKVMEALSRAIELAGIIYGRDYAMCQLLEEQRELVSKTSTLRCEDDNA